MGAIVVVLLLALLLAAAVMLYAAYPYRGEDTPITPLLGARDASWRAVAADHRHRAAHGRTGVARARFAAHAPLSPAPAPFDWIAA